MIKERLTTPLLFAQGGIDIQRSAQANMNAEELPGWWRSMKRSRLTYKDQLNKNWIQKWIHHGRFPFKFVIHLFLVIACTWMVYLVGGIQATNATSVADTWCNIILESYCDESDFTPKSFYVYNINTTVDIVHTALKNFEQSPKSGIGRITLHTTNLTVDSYLNCDSLYDTSQKRVDLATVQSIYNVSTEDLGPLKEGNKLHYFFECLQSMTLKMLVSSVHLTVDSRPVEYMWILKVSFATEGNTGRLAGSFDTDRYPVVQDTPLQYVAQTRVILNIVIIFLGFVSLVLHWLSIIRSIRIFLNVKQKIQTTKKKKLPLTWKALPLSTKLKFFNVWFILAIVGYLCNIVGSFIDIFYVWEQNIVSDTLTQVISGTGTLLSWAYMTHYLEFNRKYTVLIDALINGLPDVLRFAAGAVPVYVGFALFGFAAFSETTHRFSSFGESFVTLFGIQNGDDMQASFRALDAHLIISRIYLGLFSLVSIYTIANIFIAIINNAYHVSTEKIRKKTHEDTAEAQDIWQAIMGMDTDSESEQDQDNINITHNGMAADDTDADADNERDLKSGASLRAMSTKNSINLKGSDIGTSDEDSEL